MVCLSNYKINFNNSYKNDDNIFIIIVLLLYGSGQAVNKIGGVLVTNSEKLLSSFSEDFFYKELVYADLKFVPEGGQR